MQYFNEMITLNILKQPELDAREARLQLHLNDMVFRILPFLFNTVDFIFVPLHSTCFVHYKYKSRDLIIFPKTMLVIFNTGAGLSLESSSRQLGRQAATGFFPGFLYFPGVL